MSAAKAAWRFASRRTPKPWLRHCRAALYRRIVFGRPWNIVEALALSGRCGLQICATAAWLTDSLAGIDLSCKLRVSTVEWAFSEICAKDAMML